MNYFCTDAQGVIVRAGSCPDHLLSAQAGPGETAHAGHANIWTQYWDGGALRTYSAELLAERTLFRPGFRWTLSGWVDERSLDAVKVVKWAQIKEARRGAEFSTFTHEGNVYDSDSASQSRIQGAVQLAQLLGPAFTIDWTLADNTVVTLDAAEMVAVGLALAQHVQSVHAHGRALRAQVEAAMSQAELDAIVW